MNTSCFNPGITVGCSHDLVGEILKILLGVGVIESSTDESLCGEKSILWVCYSLYNNKNQELSRLGSLPVSWLEYQQVFGRRRWRRQLMELFSYLYKAIRLMWRQWVALTFCIFNDFWIVSFHDGDTGVGCSKIDTDDATPKEIRVARVLTRSFFGLTGW
jgi:hypothetical protein